ncbi:MAG: sigma-54-dependent Fis family transcriptional regulator, partial [Planctomycetales bacterium]|nr:sigma-54-dependent Fis family transcriptional regulator [Planctomycetales bacterium]
TESIVREAAIDSEDSGQLALAALRHSDNAQDLLVLFRLSVKLLGCDDPQDVLRNTLELIHDRTQAAVVGFLWVTEEGHLKPQMIVPLGSRDQVALSTSLTQLVIEQNRAVWVANQTQTSVEHAESLRPFADALCIPVIHDKQTLGAIHMYLGHGSFRDIDFDFAISVAQVLAVALARSRRQASLAADHERLVVSTGASNDLIGESASMAKLKELISRIAKATGCVLVRGESGSGKELVARALHRASPRSDRPLLAVNCAAVPENLIESQLFGHAEGAFTGATSEHVGWFRQADTGTLFLDEIGELPLDAQAKLLRILEGHPFLPVGGTREIRVDVRVIAATNRDLKECVRQKTFREDLYYRLSVFELVVPPLRDRGDDIAVLLDHFLAHFKQRHGRTQLELSDAARQKLLSYPWPGNVRQLRNVIDSAVVLASGSTIHVEDLGLYDAGTEDLDTLKISEWERKLMRLALQRTGGNVPESAKLLGIGRATLYRKLDEYGIER